MNSLLAEGYLGSLFFCLPLQHVYLFLQKFFFETLILDVCFKLFIVGVDFGLYVIVVLLYLLN